MADSIGQTSSAARPFLPHLRIRLSPERVDAAARGGGRTRVYQRVDRREHGRALIAQIEEIQGSIDPATREQLEHALPEEAGLILELRTAPGQPLFAEEVNGLVRGTGATLLFANRELVGTEQQMTRILLNIPRGRLVLLAEKFRRFAEENTKGGKPRNPWVANLQSLRRAAFEALWTDLQPIPDGDGPHWWELWVRRDSPEAWARFESRAVDHFRRESPLRLPEHTVVVLRARRSELERDILLLDTLAEIRRAYPVHFELTHLTVAEQQEWMNLTLSRLRSPSESAPAVCLLDTGVHRGHPLLQPVLNASDNHTIFADGDSSDCFDHGGHGTPMAGLAAYGDLRDLVGGTGEWDQAHRLEGVRMFDSRNQHEPENYGAVTQQAVYTPEIPKPGRPRVFALTITSQARQFGRPSAWSAAIDGLAFGSEEPSEPKRLFFVSAGNTSPFAEGFDYPASPDQSPIQDPSQAWNAITVGAVTGRANILEQDPESRLLTPVAPKGALSPHSRTSLDWDPHWPIKPEIVMEGGNLASHPTLGIRCRDSLDLLSTSKQFVLGPFAPTRATSAATAIAARLGARILAEYPDLWPETVRGLVIHSARWSAQMLAGLNPHRSGSTEGVTSLLRRYGYGEPNAMRAIASLRNQVTLFCESTLQPYHGSAGQAKIRDGHLHEIRLPLALLQQWAATTCTLRITLSYFVAPNPSASNRLSGSRYRYGGCLLRFDVRHKDESIEGFRGRISREAREEEPDGSSGSKDALRDPRWALGPQLRGKSGSVVQDVWQGPAADLVTMDRIAVFPVKGWWALRSFRKDSVWWRCHRRPIRYSLILSIEANADVPLYTEIQNLNSVSTEVPIQT